MKKFYILVIALIVLMGICIPITDISGAEANGTVYIIPISGEITPAMASFFKNGIRDAEKENAGALLVEISTLGGRVDAAMDMKESIAKSRVPVIVYIEDRALSAGALISLASPRIIMAPGSHIGAAEPIPYSEKAVAAIRGEFEAMAELRGRDKAIAAAMVDKNVEIPGLSPAGSLLDITADTAKEYGYAEEVLKGRGEVLKYLGFSETDVIERKPDTIIRVAQFLAQSHIASMLLTLGIIGLIIEIFTKGFGIPGIVGIGALMLYFGGGIIAGYSQWWPLILFFIGLILLIVEAFIPGFGVPGIAGITSMLISIVFAAPDPTRGLKNMGVALILVIISTPILIYYLRRSGSFNRMVLVDTVIGDSFRENKIQTGSQKPDVTGKRGIASTPLRPSGTIEIEGKKIDAMTQGEFIVPGTPVRVIESGGMTIVVEEDKQ